MNIHDATSNMELKLASENRTFSCFWGLIELYTAGAVIAPTIQMSIAVQNKRLLRHHHYPAIQTGSTKKNWILKWSILLVQRYERSIKMRFGDSEIWGPQRECLMLVDQS